MGSSNGNYQQIQQQMISYKKAYQAQQIKNQRLKQQLQQNNQMYSSQINSLKQDNQRQQYILLQQSMYHPINRLLSYPYSKNETIIPDAGTRYYHRNVIPEMMQILDD